MSHDDQYKILFSSREITEDFIKYFTISDQEFINKIDMESLEMVETQYKNRKGDRVWKAKIKNSSRTIFFLLLLEFQSTVDFYMPIRIANYTSGLFLNLGHQKIINIKTDPLPIVMPVVIYNGDSKWDVPTDLNSMYDNVPKDLVKYQLNQSYMLLDLSCFEPNHKINSILNGLFSLEETIHNNKDNFKDLFEEISLQHPTHSLTSQKIINSFLGYLEAKIMARAYNNEELTPMSFETKIKKAFEQERLEGIQVGIQQGIEKGKLENALTTAKSLISMNILTPQQICEVTGLTEEQLKENNLI